MSKSTDRRKWIKTPKELNFEYPDASFEELEQQQQKRSLKSSIKKKQSIFQQHEVDHINKKYEEYLTQLHYNNRIAKMLEEKDDKQKELKEKENGFSLYVNGAHKPPEKCTPKHVVTTARSNRLSIASMINMPKIQLIREDLCEKAKCKTDRPSTERRKWSNSSSIVIKTTDGLRIRLNAPQKHEQDYNYSDDFESDLSDEEVDTKKSLIKTVKFSDDDDDDFNESDFNEKSIELSINEFKSLKESLNMMSLSFENESIDEQICEEPKIIEQTSEKCDFILKNIAILKPNERKELLKFLKEIDTDTS